MAPKSTTMAILVSISMVSDPVLVVLTRLTCSLVVLGRSMVAFPLSVLFAINVVLLVLGPITALTLLLWLIVLVKDRYGELVKHFMRTCETDLLSERPSGS